MLGDVHHTVRIEVQSHHRIVRFGLGGLLLNAQTVAVLVKLSYAIAFWVVDIIAEYGGLTFLFSIFYSLFQHACETTTVEDVVTQYQTGTVVANELLANDEGLSQTVGAGLFSILEANT